jgi:hypothetical protein
MFQNVAVIDEVPGIFERYLDNDRGCIAYAAFVSFASA